MSDDLDELEAIAKATEAVHPGPWHGSLHCGDGPVSRPVSDGSFYTLAYELPDEEGGGHELARHFAAFSPDVVLRLIARIRKLEKRCHVVESHPVDYAIDHLPAAEQVPLLMERLLDERHKTYQLEHEIAAAEHHIEVCSEAAYVARGQCPYCDREPAY